MIPTAKILQAVSQLAGRASPPAIRRVLGLPRPLEREGDELVIALEQLRSAGELAVVWSKLGNAFYRIELNRKEDHESEIETTTGN